MQREIMFDPSGTGSRQAGGALGVAIEFFGLIILSPKLPSSETVLARTITQSVVI